MSSSLLSALKLFQRSGHNSWACSSHFDRARFNTWSARVLEGRRGHRGVDVGANELHSDRSLHSATVIGNSFPKSNSFRSGSRNHEVLRLWRFIFVHKWWKNPSQFNPNFSQVCLWMPWAAHLKSRSDSHSTSSSHLSRRKYSPPPSSLIPPRAACKMERCTLSKIAAIVLPLTATFLSCLLHFQLKAPGTLPQSNSFQTFIISKHCRSLTTWAATFH